MTARRERGSSVDRRKFLSAGGFSLTAAFLAACGLDRSERAQRLLDLAERKNEGVERTLFRHTSMDSAKRSAKFAGAAFPSYYVAKTVPVWDERVRGPWALEVSGLVQRPMRFSLEDLRRLPMRGSAWTTSASRDGPPSRSGRAFA